MARWRLAAAPRVLLLGAAYVLFMVLGALVFWAIEAPRERESQRVLRERLAGVRAANLSCHAPADIEKLVALVLEARSVGVISADGSVSNLTNWDFDSAIFFAGTVVTTIGYGNLAPATVGGKVFCIVFAAFGIPLNVVVMNKVGGAILHGLDHIAELLRKRGFKQGSHRTLTTGVFVGLGMVIFLLFPSVIFMAMEGWNYAESAYYAFVTLSTIGFGDYVVGSKPHVRYTPLYKSMVAVWILFGLAWLSAVFSAVIALLERLGDELGREERGDPGERGERDPGPCAGPPDPGRGDTENEGPGRAGQTEMETPRVPDSAEKTGGTTGGGEETVDLEDSGPEEGAGKEDPGPGGSAGNGDLHESGLGGDMEKGDRGPEGGAEKGDLEDSSSGGTEKGEPGPGGNTGNLQESGLGGVVEKGDPGAGEGTGNGDSVGSDAPDTPGLAPVPSTEAQTGGDDT